MGCGLAIWGCDSRGRKSSKLQKCRHRAGPAAPTLGTFGVGSRCISRMRSPLHRWDMRVETLRARANELKGVAGPRIERKREKVGTQESSRSGERGGWWERERESRSGD